MVIIYVVTDMRLSPTQQQMTAVYPHSQGGFMIIDFHTHTFPDELADRAVGTLAHSGGIHNYLDGRVHSLTDSMKKLELITPYCFPWQPSLISATQSIHLH